MRFIKALVSITVYRREGFVLTADSGGVNAEQSMDDIMSNYIYIYMYMGIHTICVYIYIDVITCAHMYTVTLTGAPIQKVVIFRQSTWTCRDMF